VSAGGCASRRGGSAIRDTSAPSCAIARSIAVDQTWPVLSRTQFLNSWRAQNIGPGAMETP